MATENQDVKLNNFKGVVNNSMESDLQGGNVKVCDMHTGGEPVRIIEEGVPTPQGDTLTEKVRYMQTHLDHYRVYILSEPRGHRDMFGAFLVPPDLPGAHAAVIFMHNAGYMTMCGHVTISLGRYLVDTGIVKGISPVTNILLQCPCGPVQVFVDYSDGETGMVRFQSVPSYLYKKDFPVRIQRNGESLATTVDVSFGGAFYAIISDEKLGLKLKDTPCEVIRQIGGDITEILRQDLKIELPGGGVGTLCGTIVTDGDDLHGDEPSTNVCVFGDRQVDRSPCGSGSTSRIAQQYFRGLVNLKQSRTFRSISRSEFTTTPIRSVVLDGVKCVVVEVSGKGNYIGHSCYKLEKGDILGRGFFIR